LGRDLKSIFENLEEQSKAQKAEIEELRNQLLTANQQVVQENQTTSSDLEKVFEEEQRAAEADQANLLSQIKLLIEESGQKRSARLREGVNKARSGMSHSTDTLQNATDTYRIGMEHWIQRDAQIMADMATSKDNIKNRMQEDWAVSLELSQNTTATSNFILAV